MGIEYFLSPDGFSINFQTTDGQFGTLSETETEKVDNILEMVSTRFIGCIERLELRYRIKMANKPVRQIVFENFKMARRFCKCNLSMLDHIFDIDDNGNMHLEKVHCPLHGECPDENVICNPKVNTGLAKRELEVVRLIAQGLTDEQISNRLFISPYTAENHRKSILKKLDLHSKQDIVRWAFENGQISDNLL